MPTVHPSAVLDGDVTLADSVTVGPGCVLTGPITIGPGTRLIGNVYLHGPLTLGANNTVYPFCCLGFAPQHTRFDPATPGQGTVIGDGNTFREGVTIHRAFEPGGPTSIGDRNYFMAASHAGHDCHIGNDCTFANAAALGGHVTVGDRVTTSGNIGIHQFCRVGRGAMTTACVFSSHDVPPWFTLTGTNICGAVNVIGMRRAGLSRDAIDTVRWVHRTLYRAGLPVSAAVDRLRERSDDPLVSEYIVFIETSKRGICPGTGKAIRGTA